MYKDEELQQALNKVLDRYYSDTYDPYTVVDFLVTQFTKPMEAYVETVASSTIAGAFLSTIAAGIPNQCKTFHAYRRDVEDGMDDVWSEDEKVLYEYTMYNLQGVPLAKQEMLDSAYILSNVDKLSLSVPLSINLYLLGLSGGVWDVEDEKNIYEKLYESRQAYMKNYGKVLANKVPLSSLYSVDMLLALIYSVVELKRYGIAKFIFDEFSESIQDKDDVDGLADFFADVKLRVKMPLRAIYGSTGYNLSKEDYFDDYLKPSLMQRLQQFENYELRLVDDYAKDIDSDTLPTPHEVIKDKFISPILRVFPSLVSVDYDYKDRETEESAGQVKEKA